MTMQQLIESRIAEYCLSAPSTGYGQLSWLEYGYEFTSSAVEIANDGKGNQAWADDECLLYSYANGGEELRDRESVCQNLRAIHVDDATIQSMDDDTLWAKVVSQEIAPW